MNDVAIVGGGLAGMTAALRLLERGCRVTLYDSGTRLGGKAGAYTDVTGYNDHAYHIFPMWYLNVWKLVEELGIGDNFVDCTEYWHLEAGQFPHFKVLRNMASVKSLPQNLFSGVLPVPEMFLFFYSLLDLITQRYSERSLLDQISATGFIRSRFYRTEQLAEQYQDMMLKGISVPSYFVSTMTMRQVMRYWLRYSAPMFRIPRGNLQQFWIDPIEERLRQLGCKIVLGHQLERIEVSGDTVKELNFVNEASEKIGVPVEKAIVAVPCECLEQVLDDRVYRSAPDLFRIQGLNVRPMASLNLYLRRKVPGIPKHHVDLVNSRFSLSFIDISQFWTGYDTTVLNLIASDFETLAPLSPDEAVQQLVADLCQFFPQITADDIQQFYFQSHVQQPLFMNDVGAWQFRLDARTQLKNLFVAGDHCRSHVDLVSMEGAVTTGLLAAEALRKDAGIEPAVEILIPKTYPAILMLLGKWALLPAAGLAKLTALVLGR
ncbi:MAG: FAD-dependent oxidoreductase [Candidatus Sulfotelmatobacter sp.]